MTRPLTGLGSLRGSARRFAALGQFGKIDADVVIVGCAGFGGIIRSRISQTEIGRFNFGEPFLPPSLPPPDRATTLSYYPAAHSEC